MEECKPKFSYSVLAKERIEENLIPRRFLQNKVVNSQLTDIVELSKQISIITKDILVHEAEIRKLRNHLIEKNAEASTTLTTAALTLMGLRNERQAVEMDSIFLEDDEAGRGQSQRRTISEITLSLRLLYLQDPVEQLSQDALALVNENTSDWTTAENARIESADS